MNCAGREDRQPFQWFSPPAIPNYDAAQTSGYSPPNVRLEFEALQSRDDIKTIEMVRRHMTTAGTGRSRDPNLKVGENERLSTTRESGTERYCAAIRYSTYEKPRGGADLVASEPAEIKSSTATDSVVFRR